ncbi:FI18412p1 [Strongyloides ratti]|uniref:FI18412p1 n=1 Tax=Strongyloides ratti TaxID=34506 RepID=A0A090L951_STRRB|nr:FI18412p1 [Strongyloides ratti]CEF64668.1 FI18412p1 [Strongyloides ratti]
MEKEFWQKNFPKEEVFSSGNKNQPDIYLCKYDLKNSKYNENKKRSVILKIFLKSISFLPIINWLPKYNFKENFISDIVSGFTTGIIHVPQGIAYAKLSGVSAVYGLYVSFLGPFLYLFFGTSKHASIGSVSFIALMTGVTNEMIQEKYHIGDFKEYNKTFIYNNNEEWKKDVTPIQITTSLTFTIGIILFISAILRLKVLTTYMPDSLIKGFTTGAAVHVLLSQIDDIFGVNIPRISGFGNIIFKLIALTKKIPNINFITLLSSIFTIVFLWIGDIFITPYIKRKISPKLVIPFEMIIMAIFIFISYFFKFNHNFNVGIVGEVSNTLPKAELPNFKIIPDIIINGIMISIVIMTVHLSMTKMLATNMNYEKELNSGQELYAISFTSTISSFFPVYPSALAIGRTMVLVSSGGKTQLTNLFSAAFLLFVILAIGPFLYHLPMCILSSIIAFALRSMFKNLLTIKSVWMSSQYDGMIWIVSFLTTVFTDIVYGLVISIIFALFTIVLRTQKPKWSLLFPVASSFIIPLSRNKSKSLGDKVDEISNWNGENEYSPLFAVHRFEGPLVFTNGDMFRDSCFNSMDELKERVRIRNSSVPGDMTSLISDIVLILDFSRISQIDLAGIKVINEIITHAEMLKIQLIITSLSYSASKSFNKAGIVKRGIPIYDNVQKAINAVIHFDYNTHKCNDNICIKM